MRHTNADMLAENARGRSTEPKREDLQALEQKYQLAMQAKASAKTSEEYTRVRQMFVDLGNYKDAVELNRFCEAVGEQIYESETNRTAAKERSAEAEPIRVARPLFPARDAEKEKKIRRVVLVAAVLVLALTLSVLTYFAGHRWTNMVDISCGHWHTIGVDADGRVRAVGYDRYGQCQVSGWTNIVQVAAGEHHSVGLKSDGTVVAAGSNKYGQCDVSEWRDIVAVSACENYTVGLKSDGTVVAAGSNSNGQCRVEDLENIVQVCASRRMTLALNREGDIIGVTDSVHEKYAQDWPEVIKIAANKFNFMGLKPDGTVICTGSDLYGQLAVETWTDIVDIASGYEHSVGLKADGTVVAAGFNTYGECDVENWTGIVKVIAGNRITIGIKADGSIVAAGDYKYGGLMAVWASEE